MSQRQVKGSLFVDYVRMIKSRKDVNWSRHLTGEDLAFLDQVIEEAKWFPMKSFERMGIGILTEIAGGNFEAAHLWGRFSMDALFSLHPDLVAEENPLESIFRFQVLRRSFFNFDAISIRSMQNKQVVIEIDYQMSKLAERAACCQTAGFFERVLELSGAREITHEFTQQAWETSPPTLLKLTWS